MLYFLFLEKSAMSRSPTLSKWIKGWSSTLGREVEVLDPAGWFERGHNHDGEDMNLDGVWIPKFKAGTFVWIPAPAVARVVIEELGQASYNLTQSSHGLGLPILLWS